MLNEPINWRDLRRHWWKVAIVGVIGVAFTVFLIVTSDGTPKTVQLRSHEDVVEIDGSEVVAGIGASKNDARAVGRVLHDEKWFQPSTRASAVVEHDDRWTVALVVVAPNRDAAIRARLLAEPLSRALGGQALDVALSDQVATPLYKAPWEKRLRSYSSHAVTLVASPDHDEGNRRALDALVELDWTGELLIDMQGDRLTATVALAEVTPTIEARMRSLAAVLSTAFEKIAVDVELVNDALEPHHTISWQGLNPTTPRRM